MGKVGAGAREWEVDQRGRGGAEACVLGLGGQRRGGGTRGQGLLTCPSVFDWLMHTAPARPYVAPLQVSRILCSLTRSALKPPSLSLTTDDKTPKGDA